MGLGGKCGIIVETPDGGTGIVTQSCRMWKSALIWVRVSIRTSWAAAHDDNGAHSLKGHTIHPRDRKSFPSPLLSSPQLTNAARSSLEHPFPSLRPANSSSSTSTSRALPLPEGLSSMSTAALHMTSENSRKMAHPERISTAKS
jgi:hypothetical protein